MRLYILKERVMKTFTKSIEEKVIAGQIITMEEALKLAQSKETSELYTAADRVREKYNGNKVDLCTIMNAKSGRCSENCKFCAQSAFYQTGVENYPLVDLDNAVATAKENELAGAHRFSLVTSGKGLSGKDFEKVIQIYETLRKETNLKLCASLGILTLQQAVALRDVGVTMYHHNVETSRSFFSNICDTHSYDDRLDTIRNVMEAGLEVCSGGIIGMGETMQQRLEMAFELRELGVKSIPVNVLNPIKGTPLESNVIMDAEEVLKTIAIFRLINPSAYIRYAGGRNALGELQRQGFKAGVNAALVGNFLTTVGNSIAEDIEMVTSEGFEV